MPSPPASSINTRDRPRRGARPGVLPLRHACGVLRGSQMRAREAVRSGLWPACAGTHHQCEQSSTRTSACTGSQNFRCDCVCTKKKPMARFTSPRPPSWLQSLKPPPDRRGQLFVSDPERIALTQVRGLVCRRAYRSVTRSRGSHKLKHHLKRYSPPVFQQQTWLDSGASAALSTPDVQVFEFWLRAGIRLEKNMRKTHSLHRASMVDSEGVVARVA
jgi:hypothetical protein